MYTLGGTGESAFPATIHLELWYTYLHNSHTHGVINEHNVPLFFRLAMHPISHAQRREMTIKKKDFDFVTNDQEQSQVMIWRPLFLQERGLNISNVNLK